jgi:phosphoserine phosphatase
MSKLKTYPSNLLSEVKNTVFQLRDQNQDVFAAFDADGTLWNTDMGEIFFHWQIKNLKLEAFKKINTDPWTHYQNLKKMNPPTAYLWLAQICEGYSISEVQCWAKEALAKAPRFEVFSAQKQLIDLLQSLSVKIFIVTASVKWSVEPAAKLYNIPAEQVVGVNTKIFNGQVTSEQQDAITYRTGKVEALLKHTQGAKPFLCSGNSIGDLELLASATSYCIAVRSETSGSLFESEEKLYQEAKKNNWLCFEF